MGGRCCSCCCGGEITADPEEKTKFDKNDISGGPAKSRGCTDIICLILFIVHWGVFLVITFMGAQDGKPEKLYKPRDYRGDYCSLATQWNDGTNLDGYNYLTYTMNVTHSVDLIAKQLACSTAAENVLQSLLTTSEMDTYRCACCKTACSSCYGSLAVSDFSDASALSTTIASKMGDLTDVTKASSLFSTTGSNGDYFTNIWSEATSFFVPVCLKSCAAPLSTDLTAASRSYIYSPAPDAAWKTAWDKLRDNTNSAAASASIRNAIATQFTFKALPLSECPYPASYCVPFPGVDFSELEFDYCTFKMAGDVLDAVGSSAASVFEELGASSIAESATETTGELVGDFIKTLDTLAIVAVVALVVGMIFLVLLRFLVGWVVWTSIFLVLVIFALGGALLYIRSSQCNGAGLFDSGKSLASAVVVSGTNTVTGNSANEDMTGNGADYRGLQKLTRTGRTCQAWTAQTPHSHTTTPTNFPGKGLDSNYCRNPEDAPSIWCFTTDPDMRWELCSPIGVIRPECPEGYVVSSETWRKVLEVLAFVVWALGLIYLLAVCCLCKQIRLAIGINKVAAQFVYNTPQVIFVPLIQVVVGILWVIGWAASVSFLVSQVPDDYTPTGSFETYAEAYGTDDTAGKCTDQAVSGFVWRDLGDLSSTNDPCSGNMGNTAGITPKCWRCAPPRFIIDARFALSFFSFLWNNAFLIALGQCLIAGAVCVWFFAPRPEKTKQRSVRTSTWITFRYHLGSLAFGAFILAVIQFIRYLCKYIEKQAKAQKNKAMQIVMKIMQYCLWCIEKCIKFLNKNAYIQVALLGTNFCTSAKKAFYLILRNMARFGVVAYLGSVIHFIGFLFIMVATSLLGYFILKGMHDSVTPVVPILSYVALSYLVAKLYMNVFGLAVDTLLQCFLVTEEMGGDSDFVPGPLRPFLEEACKGD